MPHGERRWLYCGGSGRNWLVELVDDRARMGHITVAAHHGGDGGLTDCLAV